MTSYREAGVDLAGADQHVKRIAGSVTATWGPHVVGTFGGFAAGVTLPPDLDRPVLMMTTDGVGTKLDLARQADRWEGVGHDLVAMVVDDLAALGAMPLGLVDYMAVGQLNPDRDRRIVDSIASACRIAGCPLLGGETAVHPGVMEPDQVDLAGAAMGVVEAPAVLGPDRVETGDVIIGIASPNLRSNGFSLVRSLLAGRSLDEPSPVRDMTWGELLLSPSVIYSPAVLSVGKAVGGVHSAAHITGGGLRQNLLRAVPPTLSVEIDYDAWERPAVFGALAELGVASGEMAATFNLGVGFCLLVEPERADAVIDALAGHGHDAVKIGRVAGQP
ncbi:MAG TPA: phosphoribosylformylglycinamidine cyclo-ligase [Acidimicrobiia bacterium]|jgi:phosphoribosylformylglycinamidine cyclo-ligase